MIGSRTRVRLLSAIDAGTDNPKTERTRRETRKEPTHLKKGTHTSGMQYDAHTV
jgi:hypothetical protein